MIDGVKRTGVRVWLGKDRLAVIAIVISALFVTTPAQGHPHAWIDLHSTVLFDADGRVTGLRQIWLFDDFYTLFVLEDLDDDGDGKVEPAKLRQLAARNLGNLKEYSYFTVVRADDRIVGVEPTGEFKTFMREGRLVLIFTLRLAEALDPARTAVSYEIYDPSYYIEVLHVDENPVAFEGVASAACHYALIEPRPSVEAVAEAVALDRNQTARDGLGAVFAQRIELTCVSK